MAKKRAVKLGDVKDERQFERLRRSGCEFIIGEPHPTAGKKATRKKKRA